MVSLINHSKMVMTDSGGLQKEAFFARKYCITLREETEWVELVNGGFNSIVGANYNDILKAFKAFLTLNFTSSPDFYGQGSASSDIALSLRKISD